MLLRLLESKAWNFGITFVILLNSALLGLNTFADIRQNYENFLNIADNICLLIFTVELLLRSLCYRFKFFTNEDRWWNIFDFIIVSVSILAVQYSVLRTLRILRILRIISSFQSMKLVVNAVIKTIPSMIRITMLLSIFYYVYGVLCVEFFGKEFPEWFGNLPRALYTLFQIMTLESWSMGIVRPIMQVYPYAWILFISYIVIVGMITINLIVGVIVNSINEITQDKDADKEKYK